MRAAGRWGPLGGGGFDPVPCSKAAQTDPSKLRRPHAPAIMRSEISLTELCRVGKMKPLRSHITSETCRGVCRPKWVCYYSTTASTTLKAAHAPTRQEATRCCARAARSAELHILEGSNDRNMHASDMDMVSPERQLWAMP